MRKIRSAVALILALCVCAGTVGCGKKKSELEQLEEFAEAVLTDEAKSKAEATTTTTPEPEEIDAFANLQVTFSGTYPKSEVQYTGGNDYVEYTLSKEEGVKNGDVVTVTAKVKLQYEDGYVLSETSKDYTAEGLASYVMSLSELPEDMAAKLEQQSQDIIASNATGWQDGVTLDHADFRGYYFLTGKDGFSSYGSNQVYCVYEITANINDLYYLPDEEAHCNGTQTGFTFVKYENLMILADGTSSVNLSEGRIAYNSFKGDWSVSQNGNLGFDVSFHGYGDLDSMFNDCVTSQINEYSYENTVTSPEA